VRELVFKCPDFSFELVNGVGEVGENIRVKVIDGRRETEFPFA
jgi:hypothetical protein